MESPVDVSRYCFLPGSPFTAGSAWSVTGVTCKLSEAANNRCSKQRLLPSCRCCLNSSFIKLIQLYHLNVDQPGSCQCAVPQGCRAVAVQLLHLLQNMSKCLIMCHSTMVIAQDEVHTCPLYCGSTCRSVTGVMPAVCLLCAGFGQLVQALRRIFRKPKLQSKPSGSCLAHGTCSVHTVRSATEHILIEPGCRQFAPGRVNFLSAI